MGVRLETITDLLEAQQWASCADLASQLLSSDSELSTADKAFLNFACCRSLSNLERYSAALQPGHLAVFLSEEAGDYDLLGRSLLELAWVQHQVKGMESGAPETQRRFFRYFEQYKTIRDRYLTAQYNLGVFLRAAGQFAEALEQFKLAYVEARKRGNHELAHLSRSNAVWESLRLERVQEAEELIKQGEKYQPNEPRLRASHLLDVAHLALLKGDSQGACENAVQAAVQCSHSPDFFAVAMEIIMKVADREGDKELALVAGLIAKQQAESADRHDIMAQVVGSIRNLALRHPDAVEQLMMTIDGSK